LQSMNQELGSANENLGRLNASLEGRTRELQRANAELANLLNSVGIPMLMLGQDLTVRRFNPQAARFFNLQASDIGKPVRDIRPSIGLPHLEQACLDVLDTFAPRSRHVEDATGRTFSLMMRPYRTQENRVDGVVLALVEKTSLASINA
jgi:two-component system, chemotaxis family, CheB/CheR fusion protein